METDSGIKQTASQEPNFAYAVACYGAYIFVGVTGRIDAGPLKGFPASDKAGKVETTSGVGLVYVYKKESVGNWVFKQKLFAKDRKSNAYFGNAISINDSLAVIGAFGDRLDSGNLENNANGGAAYLFKLNKKWGMGRNPKNHPLPQDGLG